MSRDAYAAASEHLSSVFHTCLPYLLLKLEIMSALTVVVRRSVLYWYCMSGIFPFLFNGMHLQSLILFDSR